MADPGLPHAFVISLKEAKERRDRLTRRLEEQGFAYSVFEAIDGRGMDVETHPDYDTRRRHRYFGRDLQGAELGCFLSHRGVIEEIVRQGLPCAIVFEDDAIVHDTLPPVLRALTSGKVPDLVRFIARDKVYRGKHRRLSTLGDGIDLVRLQATPGGAYAYLLSLAGAKKLLARMGRIYTPVDTLMGYGWRTGIDNLVTIPSPVTHDFIEDSHIGDKRFDKTVTLTGLDRIAFPFHRFFFKLREGVAKRLYFYWRSIAPR